MIRTFDFSGTPAEFLCYLTEYGKNADEELRFHTKREGKSDDRIYETNIRALIVPSNKKIPNIVVRILGSFHWKHGLLKHCIVDFEYTDASQDWFFSFYSKFLREIDDRELLISEGSIVLAPVKPNKSLEEPIVDEGDVVSESLKATDSLKSPRVPADDVIPIPAEAADSSEEPKLPYWWPKKEATISRWRREYKNIRPLLAKGCTFIAIELELGIPRARVSQIIQYMEGRANRTRP